VLSGKEIPLSDEKLVEYSILSIVQCSRGMITGFCSLRNVPQLELVFLLNLCSNCVLYLGKGFNFSFQWSPVTGPDATGAN